MTEHDSIYSWMRLFLGLVIATVGNVGMWIIILLMPAIQQEFEIDRATASAPFVLTMIGFGRLYFMIHPLLEGEPTVLSITKKGI